MAVKAKGCLIQIIERAIQTGLREDGKNLTLRRAIRTPKTVSVPAAVTDTSLQNVLRAVDAYEGEVVRAALKLASLTAMRPANIVEARWEHIDLARRTWTIPAEQMKSGKEHMVPLSRQAMAILEQAKKWGRHGGWVFPAVAKQDTPHLHRDALSKALRSMGMQGKHVPHGFRSSFRTIMREEFGIAEDILEAQIAHAKKGAVNKAYDRTRFLKQRVPVMQQWADHLDSLSKT
jgi:integrase